MVIGVSQGHKTAQELVGVGYKCSNQGKFVGNVFRIFT